MLNKYYSFAGINLKTFPKNIKKKHQKKIFKKLKLQKSGKVLKKYNSGRLQFFLEIKSWKGIRHYQGYPIRGQRTHTNSKTKRKLRLK